ncbi:MAG: creatininase family protein [Gemmatimonadales bacterium]
MNEKGPLRIKEMTPADVREAARSNPRLILPVGTTEHQGPHMPMGADTYVIERLADELSAEFRALRAPTIEYGVNDALQKLFSGGASVRRKTLRRWVNDLLPDWEKLGITEILILTMNGFAPHTEALCTVVAGASRVRVIDVLAVDFGDLAPHIDGPIHGGEVDTSLMLHVRPDLVDMTRAVDCILPEADVRRYRRGSALELPALSAGSVGSTSRASAELGQRLYALIKDRIRQRVFGANGATSPG